MCSSALVKTNLMVLKLISTKGNHAGTKTTYSQSNDKQTEHGQTSGAKTQDRNHVRTCVDTLSRRIYTVCECAQLTCGHLGYL